MCPQTIFFVYFLTRHAMQTNLKTPSIEIKYRDQSVEKIYPKIKMHAKLTYNNVYCFRGSQVQCQAPEIGPDIS